MQWPFVTSGWFPVEGSAAHVGEGRCAQDWARSPLEGPTRGEPIVAPISGQVLTAEWGCTSYGRTIVLIKPSQRVIIRLAHLDEMFVKPGDAVLAGETVLGLVGASGPAPACKPSSLQAPVHAHLHVSAYEYSAEGEAPRRFPLMIRWSRGGLGPL
jgi:murein DD-endopeptidase MepM/ murein hydrolase activator NlpD